MTSLPSETGSRSIFDHALRKEWGVGILAWEDGGNSVPAPVGNADFFYNVTGKCDFNKRPNNTRLTQ